MKRILFIALAAFAFATASQAQDSSMHRKMDHPPMKGEKMWDNLNLTQDQKDKLKQYREDNMKKMEEIRNNSSLSEDQKQEKMKALREEGRKNTESILTDEQKKKMKEMRDDRMKERKEMRSASDTATTRQ